MLIETKRLYITPPNELDLEDLCKLQADPEVMRFIGTGVRDRATVQKGLDKAIEHYKKWTYSLGSVYEKSSDQFIGRAGLIHLEYDDQKEIEVGYALHKESWNKGYATELTQFLIQWGFEQLPIDFIVGIVRHQNEGSQNVLLKSGMQYVKEYCYNGIACCYYQINRRK